jgi:hypothetical protein
MFPSLIGGRIAAPNFRRQVCEKAKSKNKNWRVTETVVEQIDEQRTFQSVLGVFEKGKAESFEWL